MAHEQALPLKDLIVISIEQAVAAPFCSSRLADAGATVIKIERPEGDFARGYDDAVAGQSSYFVWLNRGKRSLVLDLTKPEDREVLEHMLVGADVLIQNLKPGSLDRLGFSPQRLRERDPRLIVCSISGYGNEGPYVTRKAYDLLIQAESGLASLTGGPDAPARVGISIVDIATGATAHAAILEALIARDRTGVGCDINVSMFDVMADWLSVPLLLHEGGQGPTRIGLAHPSIAPYGVFASKDGDRLLISIQSDREWQAFCRGVLEDRALGVDERFATNVARVRNRAATDAAVSDAFARFSRRELLERLTRCEIAFAEVNDMAALARHPHLRRIIVDTANGEVAIPAAAARFDGAVRNHGPVPALGEYGETVRTVEAPSMAQGNRG